MDRHAVQRRQVTRDLVRAHPVPTVTMSASRRLECLCGHGRASRSADTAPLAAMPKPTASVPVMRRRELNRALLARQHLLERVAMPTGAMIAHLVGLQAQSPRDPYFALWSRIEGFEPHELEALLLERRAVRLPVMRTTLHLVTADDALTLRPLVQPVLERTFRTSTPWGRRLPETNTGELLAAGREIVDAQPRTTKGLANALAERWPDRDPEAMSQAVRYALPLVQIPPRGLWTKTLQPTWMALETWLGRPIDPEPSIDAVVLRYLAAFGPATVIDIQTWCWLTRLREVVERLRPRLVTFRDEDGRERFDLPDAPRPPEDTPAPPRFLPEYDNIALSHKDRRHVIADAAFGRITGYAGTFTVDGFVCGQWRIDGNRETATLVLDPFEPLSPANSEALVAEGARLLAWHSPAAGTRRVEFGPSRPSVAAPARPARAR
jgi:hypothetical protein